MSENERKLFHKSVLLYKSSVLSTTREQYQKLLNFDGVLNRFVVLEITL